MLVDILQILYLLVEISIMDSRLSLNQDELFQILNIYVKIV